MHENTVRSQRALIHSLTHHSHTRYVGIRDWTVSKTTLEEIFFSIVREAMLQRPRDSV